MSTTSPLLRLTLQALDENPDNWGTILNNSALRLLEDGIASTASVTLVGEAEYTLPDVDGSTAEARAMILNMGGSSNAPTDVVVPTRSKVYLVSNTSDDIIEVRTALGTGPTIPSGEAQWVFCDGTNVLAASAATATSAGTATTAADADALIGVAGADYSNKTLAGTFTAGQVSTRDSTTYSPVTTGTLQINCALSNSFYVLAENTFQMLAPQNATDGQVFTLAIEQGGGGPHGITFAPDTFQFAGGTAPTLSTLAGQCDYLAFEYVGSRVSNVTYGTGPRWWGSQLKNMADV
jgi:hypothetical protein